MHCVCPGELKADINQTLEAFEHILLLYKSGLHLDNLPPSIIRGKKAGDWNEGCFFSSSTMGPHVGECLAPFDSLFEKTKNSQPYLHFVSLKTEGGVFLPFRLF